MGETIVIRVNSALKKKIKELADKDDRTNSSYLRRLISNKIKEI